MKVNRIALGTKLLAAFLVVGLIPLAAAAFISLWNSTSALENSTMDQLDAVRTIKASQIQSYFQERRNDLNGLADTIQSKIQDGGRHLDAVQSSQGRAIETWFATVMTDIKTQQDRSICTQGLGEYRQEMATGEKTAEYRRFADIIETLMKGQLYTDFFRYRPGRRLRFQSPEESLLSSKPFLGIG